MLSIVDKNGTIFSADSVEKVIELYRAFQSEECNGDGWITWKGGERPIPDVPVTIILRNGKKVFGTASRFVWYQFGSAGDIVAYKVVK